MRIFTTNFSLIFIFLISCSSEPQYQPVTHFNPNRDVHLDLLNAIKEAQRSERHILLDVGGDWCVWCKKLDRFFNENSDINKFMHANYVVMKVNYSPENKNENFLSQYPKISGYPHFFVLNQNGQLIHSQETGSLESGDKHDRDEVFAFLKKWTIARD